MGRTSDARERIIESAVELFHSRTAGGVGVQEICQHASVKKGSFYHFFSSKQDLILATLDRNWDDVQKHLWEPAFAQTLRPLQRIEKFAELLYHFSACEKRRSGQIRGCKFGNIAAEMSAQDATVRQKVNAIFDKAVAYLRSALDDAVALGDLLPLDTGKAAQALWAYLEGCFLIAKSQQDPKVLRQLTQTAIQLLSALGRKAPVKRA